MSQPSAPPPGYAEATGAPPPGPPNTQYGYQQPPPQSYPPPQQGYPPPQQGYPQPAGYQTAPQGYGHGRGMAEPAGDPEAAAFNTSSFSDKTIRHRFIMKVYLIVLAQMLFTAGLIALFLFVTPVRLWVQTNIWFYILAYVTFLITYIVLACCPGVRRKYPGNYIALIVFTVMFAYVAAAIASYHDAQAVLIAAGITTFVALAISIFAIQTKIDFTMCSGLIFAACITLLLAGLCFMFVAIFVTDDKNRYILQCVYGTIAALIISLVSSIYFSQLFLGLLTDLLRIGRVGKLLVYDTQLIVGGRSIALSPEEHILGALQLYMDVTYLFLIMLSFFKQ